MHFFISTTMLVTMLHKSDMIKKSTIIDTVKHNLGVHMNYKSAGDYEHVSECNNFMVINCIRSIFHSLTFRMTPNLIVR